MPPFSIPVILISLLLTAEATDFKKTHNSPLVAYIHPGPGKTGTTHIQAFMISSESTLLQNNLALWPDFYSSFLQCKNESLLPSSAKMWSKRDKQLAYYGKFFHRCPYMQQTIHAFIKESYKLKRNIFFSSESLTPIGRKDIIDVLVNEGYVIHGIVVYRFPLSWFISRYRELIHTHSISSPENEPRNQNISINFSEYLLHDWDVRFRKHFIDIFQESLSRYTGHRLSIVDMYGTEAAGFDITYALVCQVIGILCESNSFQQYIDKDAHAGKEQHEIIERQMAATFAKYASNSDCHMVFTNMRGLARRFLHDNVMHKWKGTIPLRLAMNLKRYANKSIEIDKSLRVRHRDLFVNGNAEANAMKANPLPEVLEVDEEAVLSSKEWQQQLYRRLMSAKKKGLCANLDNYYLK